MPYLATLKGIIGNLKSFESPSDSVVPNTSEVPRGKTFSLSYTQPNPMINRYALNIPQL